MQYSEKETIAPVRPYVFVDMDGTLADLTHRLHYIQQRPKDHDSFYREISGDTVFPVIRRWVNELYESGEYYIMIVTARRASCYVETATWLWENNIHYHGLVMPRADDDHRPDPVIKRDILEQFKSLGREVAFVIDDRPSVIRMWRDNRVKVYPVNQERWEESPDTDMELYEKTIAGEIN